MNAIIPIPRCSVSIRPATIGDYAFIDRLQQMHSKAVGFMPKTQIEVKLKAGHILIADSEAVGSEAVKREENDGVTASPLHCVTPIGYVMSQDRYFKRDDVGIVYQMNVSPGAQRKLVAATMLQAVFDRAAYGCKLFCCWCAQDLAANYFWESMGFVPLAFRTGAVGSGRRAKVRTHIFWQKRIREEDTTTPYWYPCKTDGGSMRADRLVLPIPSHVHWRDAMPILIPEAQKALPSAGVLAEKKKERGTLKPHFVQSRRALFGSPEADAALEQAMEKAKPQKRKREKVKANPAHVAAARELRDRYLEHVNGEPYNGGVGADGNVLPRGKYALSRAGSAAGPLLLEQAA